MPTAIDSSNQAGTADRKALTSACERDRARCPAACASTASPTDWPLVTHRSTILRPAHDDWTGHGAQAFMGSLRPQRPLAEA